MNSDRITREEIRELFINIKPYFRDRLGKYTHQRISGNWHFHGLGFVNGDMTYVFGVNLGFFKVGKETNYSHAGMNVLVRTNGLNKNLRKQYRDFFRENLSDWIHGDEKLYNSDRGGIGSEFPRYKKISNFQNQNELLNFFKECGIRYMSIF